MHERPSWSAATRRLLLLRMWQAAALGLVATPAFSQEAPDTMSPGGMSKAEREYRDLYMENKTLKWQAEEVDKTVAWLLAFHAAELFSAQSTIASLRQDLDRISAEREAYREAARRLVDGRDKLNLAQEARAYPSESVQVRAHDVENIRRILAENDR